jgi:hypothetical protein
MNQPNRLESEIIKGVKSAQKDYENMTDGWWLSHGPESFLMAMVANQIFKKGDFWVFPEASPKNDRTGNGGEAKTRPPPQSSDKALRYRPHNETLPVTGILH